MTESIEKAEAGMTEIGATGLKQSGGRIHEEFLHELTGENRHREIARMSENDPIVGGVLLMIEMLVRTVDWRVEPAGEDPEDVDRAEFTQSCLHDMSSSWEETLAEILSFLPYGYSVHETVYKRRRGPDVARGEPVSAFSDDRIGWRKLPIRGQETIDEWIFDEGGGIDGIIQALESGGRASIPIEKLALFRTSSRKNNPEGRSILRRAWRPWRMKTSIEEYEAIGIERDLAGFPVGKVPAKWFSAQATPEERAALEQWTAAIRDIKRDDMEGIVIPAAFDKEHGNALYGIELLKAGGARQIDVSKTIVRKNQEIATAMLADFIVLGHESVGSFALSKTKTEMFYVALGAWLDAVADVFNRHLIPRLHRLNGWNGPYPTLARSQLEQVDLEVLGKYLQALSGVGYPLFPNEMLEDALADAAKLPAPDRTDGIDRSEPAREEEPPPDDLEDL